MGTTLSCLIKFQSNAVPSENNTETTVSPTLSTLNEIPEENTVDSVNNIVSTTVQFKTLDVDPLVSKIIIII